LSAFSETFLDHFLKPRNVGELSNADIVGTAEELEKGGKIIFYINLEGNKIKEIKYKVLGCPAAISAASIISEKSLNLNILEAKDFSVENLKEWLGEMPDSIFECAKLALQAFHNGITEFLERRRDG